MPARIRSISRAEARNQRLRKIAARLFLKRGYDNVSIDQIVELAGGSKSTVYSAFGGKCGLFISSIEELCREANKPLEEMNLTGLSLEASLKKAGLQILTQATTRQSIELHRLAVGEAVHCPEVGKAWYTHGPQRRIAFVQSILDKHRTKMRGTSLSNRTLATMLHDAWTGDITSRIITSITRRESEAALRQKIEETVNLVLGQA
jgi:AcrR family transcriptional regulator